jgi:hypothetical protein
MSLLLAAQSVGYTLSIDQGSYSFAGNDIGLYKGSRIAFDQGVYSLTGNDINFSRNYVLAFDQGNYTLTGNDIDFVYTTPPILGSDKKFNLSFVSNFVLK